MFSRLFKPNIWKVLTTIIIGLIIFILRGWSMPACGYDPTWVDPPRCATPLTDGLLGLIILLGIYLIVMIIYFFLSKRSDN